MERLLILIKHNFNFIWNFIEKINGFIFKILYSSNLEDTIRTKLTEIYTDEFKYRRINSNDLLLLQNLKNSQSEMDLKYFNPHGFDSESLKQKFKNPAFLMMGAFDGEKMVGYFFLRFFINRKCFVGRLIDKDYRGKGIGQTMNKIMYETAWRMGFRCLSTISKNNEMVMKAHSKNPYMKILKELDNDYLLVEFIRSKAEG